MIRRAAVAAVAVAALATAPATAAPERKALIVPGQQIGKVRLGMTFAQVTRALGRPTVVNRQVRTGLGRYVEYDWGWGEWTVGFSGRGSSSRVSLIGTALQRERTREGVGVGSRRARVISVYRRSGVRCGIVRPYPNTQEGCRLGPRSRETVFRVSYVCTADLPPAVAAYACPTRHQRLVVTEVLIKTPAAQRDDL